MRFDGIPRSLQDYLDLFSRRLDKLERAKAASGGGSGEPGPPGPAGDDGRTILSGSGAPGPGLGANGDFYVNTASSALYGPKTAGAWGSATPLVGPPGADGVDGADGADGADGIDGTAILNGAGAPGGGTGVDGDFYINTTTNELYGPKTAGAWGSPTSLVGVILIEAVDTEPPAGTPYGTIVYRKV